MVVPTQLWCMRHHAGGVADREPVEDALGESVEVSKTRHSYDLIAVAYAAAMADELGGKPLDRALLDVVAELAAGGAIVDVGCGPGQVMAHLAGRGARVVGLDLSPVMCATGARATSLPFCAAEMTALPIRSRTLAAIVRLYAVIHLGAAHVGRPTTSSLYGSCPRRAGSRRRGCCRPGRAYEGSARNFRRLVAAQKALWRRDHHSGRRPAVWTPGEYLVIDWAAVGAGLHLFCAGWVRFR